ncbi:Uma2 family endonuclease [Thiorhodococcus mannitoliphagus]|uniref:Uma2 family endonuclease n=1 Tax=Thiorhodococcus mannitoliphagus TaxID=329406 RepID=A0A6P1E0W1_9GAMM|nr:Uma2 family endonuclease [Thiorhodococcus mannitoliphagus]NEX22112.1 Uma2 family endonuclease [Thiorhodococcus mannitoliphagus]
MSTTSRPNQSGPFRADQLHEGDRYELSNGHPIYCTPSGREHAGRNLSGGGALETDPDVEWAGVDAGFTPMPGTLRAPDVAIAAAGDEQGWIPGVPPLAVEYSGPGQNDQELEDKIAELLANGTQQVWVVRLVGPRRVEVRCPNQPVRMLGPGEMLTAPGILRNPVPVEALFDREASHRVMLRNLLQRAGYESIEAIRDEGVNEGLGRGIAESILALLADRGLTLDAASRERILGCRDARQLRRWLLAAARVEDPARLFD